MRPCRMRSAAGACARWGASARTRSANPASGTHALSGGTSVAYGLADIARHVIVTQLEPSFSFGKSHPMTQRTTS
jgi:hypothetical protein